LQKKKNKKKKKKKKKISKNYDEDKEIKKREFHKSVRDNPRPIITPSLIKETKKKKKGT